MNLFTLTMPFSEDKKCVTNIKTTLSIIIQILEFHFIFEDLWWQAAALSTLLRGTPFRI